jgi:hypothetical protein
MSSMHALKTGWFQEVLSSPEDGCRYMPLAGDKQCLLL